MLAHKDIGHTQGCRKCYMIQRGDNSYPGLGHTAKCRARVEEQMAENPELAKKLERARQRKLEYHERMMGAGDTREDTKAKRARLDSGIGQGGGCSVAAQPDAQAEVYQDDELEKKLIQPEEVYVDTPIPASDAPADAPAGSREKRRSNEPPDDDRGGKYRTVEVEDPDKPEDNEAGNMQENPFSNGTSVDDEAPEVLMLGRRCPERPPARYEVCGLFSPARVSAAASARGLRGGWALDLECVDPITGAMWDLSEQRSQDKVWRMLRRDKPLVVGMSPACTLCSILQNERTIKMPAEELAVAMACFCFRVRVAKYQMARGRFLHFEHPLSATC